MFRNILVAYDGSPTSRSALAQAYELAAAENSDVTVVTVAPTVAPLAALAPASVEGLRAELDHWARTKLEEAKAAGPADLTVRTVERTGQWATKSSTRSSPATTTSSSWAHAATAG